MREGKIFSFHVLEDKEISNMWTTGLVTQIFFDSGLEDSDSEVMTPTRTWR